MNGLEKMLEFIIEIERLKDVHRKSVPVGLDRYENSAEHSWHACLSALILKDYADDCIDIDRVIRMLLIHDLGEIDAGDTIVYHSEAPELKAAEAADVERLMGLLPHDRRAEYMTLWYEFEAGETADSKYARAIDRVPPLLQNLRGGGHTWKKNGIAKEMVFSLNSRIKHGSQELWHLLESKLEEAAASGIL